MSVWKRGSCDGCAQHPAGAPSIAPARPASPRCAQHPSGAPSIHQVRQASIRCAQHLRQRAARAHAPFLGSMGPKVATPRASCGRASSHARICDSVSSGVVVLNVCRSCVKKKWGSTAEAANRGEGVAKAGRRAVPAAALLACACLAQEQGVCPGDTFCPRVRCATSHGVGAVGLCCGGFILPVSAPARR